MSGSSESKAETKWLSSTLEENNGWVLVDLLDSSPNRLTEDEEIQEILSDYVVITAQELTDCGEYSGVKKTTKTRRFLKVPSRRFYMPYPRLFMPKQYHKIGKIKTHCPSIQRVQPYLRVRSDNHYGQLQNSSATWPRNENCLEVQTPQKSQSIFSGATETKKNKISTFAFELLPPPQKAVEEKELPEYSMTLDDLYFASTCRMINILLRIHGDAFSNRCSGTIQQKLFVSEKSNTPRSSAPPRFRSHIVSAAKQFDIPRQRADLPEPVNVCDDVARSFLPFHDESHSLKEPSRAISIYEDIVKVIESNRNYSSRLGFKDMAVGYRLDSDIATRFKLVKVTRKRSAPTVISVIVDKLKVMEENGKETNIEKFAGTVVATIYKNVMESLRFRDDDMSDACCLKASPGKTNVYQEVVKAFNSTCTTDIPTIYQLTFPPRVVNQLKDSISMQNPSPFKVEPPKFDCFLSEPHPKPLLVKWKDPSEQAVMQKAEALYEKMMVTTLSCFPQRLPKLPQIPGPTVLLWLLGCHILSVLRSYPGFWTSTDETQIRYWY